MNRPSVTQLLSPFADFSAVPPDILQAASERGTSVHAACAAYALNLPAFVPGELGGYFASFKAWFNSYVVEVLAVEEEVIHPAWGYVGHVDLIAMVAGIRPKQTVALIDYKTPAVESRSWRMQCAAYVEASRDRYGTEIAGALMLRKDGGLPKMVWIEDEAQAFNAFCGILSGFNYLKGGRDERAI
jgi:hypothetical protein